MRAALTRKVTMQKNNRVKPKVRTGKRSAGSHERLVSASSKMLKAAKLIKGAIIQIRRQDKYSLWLTHMEQLEKDVNHQGRLMWASMR